MTDNHIPLGNATATDNVIIQSITNNAPKVFPLGKTIVLWTAEDAAGNISNATQTVDAVDTTAPKITPPKDVKVEATSLTDQKIAVDAKTVAHKDRRTIQNKSRKLL